MAAEATQRATTTILLVGGGAREHAMAAAIARSRDGNLVAYLKHRNPGITKLASQFYLGDELEIDAVVDYAKQVAADLVVIGPEAPEEKGLADAVAKAGIPCASPTKAAARIETDKQFMRDLMERHNVPGRLGFHPFSDVKEALAFLDANGPVWAIKPIGLTGGKGVQVFGDHFQDVAGAKAYAASVFESGAGGGALQFEELAVGQEFTLMCLTDGTTVLPMVACQDHKRLYEGDAGPNTGGMGSYSQADGLLPFLTKGEFNDAADIVQALVDALRVEGTPYVGAIYGQFMLTVDGPKVIEINARFGDPEAMNVLHLLETDYGMLLRAMVDGELHKCKLAFRPHATVVKYAVPEGYGDGKPEPGHKVTVDEAALADEGAAIYYASIEELDDGSLSTLTSRTLAVLGEGETIAEAEAAAERGLEHVHAESLAVRHDIGTAALIERRIRHMQELRKAASTEPPAADAAVPADEAT